jgi:putative ATP-binding cassette transporter
MDSTGIISSCRIGAARIARWLTSGGKGEAPMPSDGGADSPGFMRGFLRLAMRFFTSEERWMAWLLTIGVIGLTLLQIGLVVGLNLWNRDFFNALESRDWNLFIVQMGVFALLCSATMGIAVYQV